MIKWQILIDNFLGGFAPGWWKSTYPCYGNKNMAGDMQNVDISNPTYITQGSGLTNLTNGTQAGVVTTLIKGILNMAQASNLTFAIGGNKFYELSSTAVTNNASNPILPHTINKATVTEETGEDVCYYQGAIYYSYNHSGNGGDIGKYDLTRDSDADFDDDWGSTIPATGATALQGTYPHQMISAGNDLMYILNKNYVTSYDGTNDILVEKDLDLPNNAVLQSGVWTSNKLWVSVNTPDISGSNKNVSSIYIWNGNDSSWEDEIRIDGRIGALKVKNGIIFVFHQDVTSIGGYKLGYISGNQVKDIASFKGSLPAYYQVTEEDNFIVWESSGLLYKWGAITEEIPVSLSQYADGGYSTVGGIACPFGTLLAASYDGSTNYKLAKFSGYDTACFWKSLNFDIFDGPQGKGFINSVYVYFDTLTVNSRVDMTLRCNLGGSTWGGTTTGRISYAGDGAVTKKIFYPKKEAESFRIEFDWSNGNSSNPLSIRKIKVEGHTL